MKKWIILLLFPTLLQAQISPLVFSGLEHDYHSTPYERYNYLYFIGGGIEGESTTILLRTNVANSFINGQSLYPNLQLSFEGDWYQSFGGTKTWVNYAFSRSPMFPDHRITLNLWQNLGGGWLVSGGSKHYIWQENSTILNIGLERYVGDFWIEGKTIFSVQPDLSFSYWLTGRWFFEEKDFGEIGLGFGEFLDDPITGGISKRKVGTFKFGFVNTIDRMRFRSGLSFSMEEFSHGEWRGRISLGIGFFYTL